MPSDSEETKVPPAATTTHTVGEPGLLSKLQRQRSGLWCPLSPRKHTMQNKTLQDIPSGNTQEAKVGCGARRTGQERQERVSGARTPNPIQRSIDRREAR